MRIGETSWPSEVLRALNITSSSPMKGSLSQGMFKGSQGEVPLKGLGSLSKPPKASGWEAVGTAIGRAVAWLVGVQQFMVVSQGGTKARFATD